MLTDKPIGLGIEEAQGAAKARNQTLVGHLTEVSGDSDLFDDPALEVARMAQGEAREIVIPVALGQPGQEKRFKLSLQLKLDPIDG